VITDKNQRIIQWTLITGSFLTAIFITPSFSYEPVDLPKMFVLLPIAFSLIGYVPDLKKYFKDKRFLTWNSLLILFTLQLILVLLFARAPFNQQFYGTFGRNTGFLTYIALLLVAVGATQVSDISFLTKLNKTILFVGILTTCYGLLQITKHDPIKWNNPYNPIIGFLGNPDFASAFLGISAIAGFAFIFNRNTKVLYRLLISIYLFCSFILIVKSHAQQGVLVFGIGLAIVIYEFLRTDSSLPRIWSRLFAFVGVSVGIISVLGILKIGPLSDHLYKLSVRQRGFYWHAAIKMMISNPILGVGLDSYGDNYLKYRSSNAAFHSQLTQSNAAHNVFLDMGSNGGVPLFTLYMLINLYAAWCGFKTLKNSKSYNPMFLGIFVGWIGYTAQSIVSINQIGLAIWGWVFTGAIIGFSNFDQSAKENPEPVQVSRKRRTVKKVSRSPYVLVLAILGFILGLMPFLADRNFRQATASQNANAIIAASNAYPADETRKINTAQLLAGNNLKAQALILIKDVVRENPKNYNAWNVIMNLSSPGSSDFQIALSKIKELNPHFQQSK
jgi:O-antigen ligase